MNRTPIASLSLAALASALLAIGCSSGAPGTIPDGPPPEVHHSTSLEPQSPYEFFQPTSEESLRQNTDYGYLIAKTRAGFREALFADEGLTVAGRFTYKGATYFHLRKESNLLETLENLKKVVGIIYVEPDLRVTADGGIAYTNPDPMVLSQQYSVYLTKAKDAWTTYGFGPNKPVVVDIDTGINFSHEDLQPVVQHAYSWYDLDHGNALINGTNDPTVQPIDYIGSTTHAMTDDPGGAGGHGSHTAGTIAAAGNNGKGVAGVCWNVNLVSYKGLLNGSGGTWAIYGSLYHLINWKLSTHYTHTIPVNMSLGGSSASQFAVDMVEAAVENNVAIIASMGNDGQRVAKYPAAYAGVIAVGATNGQDKKVHFSDYGRYISVSAPGYDIISTYNGSSSDYGSESGTSMSAPFVTGLVGYMLTFNPDLSVGQIRTYLEQNADFIEGATGWTDGTGWGRVNVLKTIGAVVADVNASKAPASNYLNVPVRIKVSNSFQGASTPLPGTAVYLYQCDASGAITNYVASSLTDTDSNAYFNLLRPGTYTAKANLYGTVATTSTLTLAAGATLPPQSLTFGLPLYWINTLQDAGNSANTDDIVTVWDASGKQLVKYDVGALDSVALPLTPQTYTIGITPYQTFVGEYALWVGPALYPTAVAPGSFAAPDASAVKGSQSHSKTSPQAISANMLVNANLSAAGDYYAITIK